MGRGGALLAAGVSGLLALHCVADGPAPNEPAPRESPPPPPPRQAPAQQEVEDPFDRGGRWQEAQERIRAMEPLPAREAQAYVHGRITIANVAYAAGYLADVFEATADPLPRAKAMLLNILGLASWEGVDPDGALRIYYTPGERYFGRPDFAVVKKLGQGSPVVRSNQVAVDLGTHVAIDLASMKHRLRELEPYLREDVERPPPVDPFHIWWHTSDVGDDESPLMRLLVASPHLDRELVAHGSYHEFQCLELEEPGQDAGAGEPARPSSEDLRRRGWYPAERGESIQCYGRGRAIDYGECGGYHKDNTLRFIKADNPERDARQSTKLVMEALAPTEGMRIVDVGAGMGYFTLKLARIVGAAGRIYATDVDPCAIRYIKRGMLEMGVTNVEVSHVSEDFVSLPYRQIDAFMFINTPAYRADLVDRAYDLHMYRKIHDALRPGGKLILWIPAARGIGGPGLITLMETQDIIDSVTLMGFDVVKAMTSEEMGAPGTSATGSASFLVFEKTARAPGRPAGAEGPRP